VEEVSKFIETQSYNNLIVLITIVYLIVALVFVIIYVKYDKYRNKKKQEATKRLKQNIKSQNIVIDKNSTCNNCVNLKVDYNWAGYFRGYKCIIDKSINFKNAGTADSYVCDYWQPKINRDMNLRKR
jgi:hypothetical protein